MGWRRRPLTADVSSHWVLYRSGISHGKQVRQRDDSIIPLSWLLLASLRLFDATRYPHPDVRTSRDAAYPTPRDRQDASGWRDDLLLATGGQRLAILRSCTLRTLICVGSRVTAFLGDDINGNEIQRCTGWLLVPFLNAPSSLLVTRYCSKFSSAERKGNRAAQKSPGCCEHSVYPRHTRPLILLTAKMKLEMAIRNNIVFLREGIQREIYLIAQYHKIKE